MKYETFLQLCKDTYESFKGDSYLELEYYAKPYRYNSAETPKKVTDNPYMYVEWSTGGYSGGSCWNNDPATPYVSHDSPKELDLLDAVLEKIQPSISFLQYKNLCHELVEEDSRTEHEYYGNSTDYESKKIYIKKLYEYLVSNKMINEN